MSNKINIFKGIKKSDWFEAADWLGWNSIGGLFPVLGGFFLFLIFKKTPTISDFSNNGQFAIYSATMFASAFYIVFKEYKSSIFSGRKLFGAICILGQIGAVLLFSSVTAANLGQSGVEVNRGLVRNLSFLIYFISLIMAFLLSALDKSRAYLDIQKERKEGVEKLDAEYEKLEKKNEE